MKDNSFQTIKCPNCGCEYLPAEIFYPNSLLGKPYDIVKTSAGNIDYFDGTSMDPNETFCCEKCNTRFNVKANITFSVSVDARRDFNKDPSISIFEKKLTLFEGN